MADTERSIVEVLVPGLLPASRVDATPAPRIPALSTLLARSDRHARAEADASEWLLRRFGVARGTDWPAGALSLLGDGGDPGNAYWLRADPIHLQVERDQLVLADTRLFAISRTEAETFTDVFNRHFAVESFVFYPLRPERWYLRVPALPVITTVPLAAAVGRPIDPLLPKGADALAWHRTFNEIQMLLHGLPINEEREARGDLPVNSVWLWGAGALPTPLAHPYAALVTNDPVVKGCALASDCTVLNDRDGLQRWLSEQHRGALLVHEDALDAAQAYGDDAAWSAALEELEQNVFAPLLEALKAGRIEKLRIVTFGTKQGCAFVATRASLWRFWRGTRALSSYA